MFHWISDKVLGNKNAKASTKDRIHSPTLLLEQSVAYSAFLSNQEEKGEKISFEEFLRRQNLAECRAEKIESFGNDLRD